MGRAGTGVLRVGPGHTKDLICEKMKKTNGLMDIRNSERTEIRIQYGNR
jgi:hypothetical protein